MMMPDSTQSSGSAAAYLYVRYIPYVRFIEWLHAGSVEPSHGVTIVDGSIVPATRMIDGPSVFHVRFGRPSWHGPKLVVET
jgi:hypothetical protein